jgi:uncharacterized protein (TIGR03067 family)
MTRWMVLSVIALGLAIAVQAEDAKQKKNAARDTTQANSEKQDAGQLIGTYRLVSGSRGGEVIPAERFNEVTVQIAKNAITTFDRDNKEVYAATYVLDGKKHPWRITMTATITPKGGKGTETVGLIGIEGKSVKLIYALPGGEEPTEFKTGKQQQMFVLERTNRGAGN